jgi:hypothetical protein
MRNLSFRWKLIISQRTTPTCSGFIYIPRSQQSMQPVAMDEINSGFLAPISLNNKGAELLSQGKIQESQVMFKTALARLKAITSALQKHPTRNTRTEKVDFHYLTPMPMQVDSEAFIFKRPIKVMETKGLVTCDVVVLDISCAVMFNINLTFHAQALEESQHNTKAIMAWMVALKLRRFRRNATTLFDLGLLNNIAQLYVEKIAYGRAMHYFAKVANILIHQDSSELDAVELDGFMRGVLWRPPTCAHVA